MNDDEEDTNPDVSALVPVHMEVGELPAHPYRAGKAAVLDIGKRLRQLSGLRRKESYRTPAIVAEILDRLRSGETLLSVSTDPNMPGHSTIHDWMNADPELKATVEEARAQLAPKVCMRSMTR